ncbi:MAG: pseudouridine synthase [Bacteroidetes bacterium 46-16]|nr:MAG: pseudouridine synthase [Bacteroidetes bacterium 46-16]
MQAARSQVPGGDRHRYFIINKPRNMVSQFVSSHDVGLLGDLDYDFPEGIHAIGRLDNHSEGLLILTTNKKVTKLLFESKTPHKRTYLVKVNKVVTTETLNELRNGVTIRIKGGEHYNTTPCDAEIVAEPQDLFQDNDPAALYGTYSWLLISLTEGKFHQVRKMVRALRHPCRRLIRISIEDLCLGDLQPGAVKELEEEDFFRLLKIDNYN